MSIKDRHIEIIRSLCVHYRWDCMNWVEHVQRSVFLTGSLTVFHRKNFIKKNLPPGYFFQIISRRYIIGLISGEHVGVKCSGSLWLVQTCHVVTYRARERLFWASSIATFFRQHFWVFWALIGQQLGRPSCWPIRAQNTHKHSEMLTKETQLIARAKNIEWVCFLCNHLCF